MIFQRVFSHFKSHVTLKIRLKKPKIVWIDLILQKILPSWVDSRSQDMYFHQRTVDGRALRAHKIDYDSWTHWCFWLNPKEKRLLKRQTLPTSNIFPWKFSFYTCDALKVLDCTWLSWNRSEARAIHLVDIDYGVVLRTTRVDIGHFQS